MKHISSANNEHVRHLHRLLSQGKFRRQYAQTVLEGVHLLQVFLQSGGKPLGVYIPEAKMPSEEVSDDLWYCMWLSGWRLFGGKFKC